MQVAWMRYDFKIFTAIAESIQKKYNLDLLPNKTFRSRFGKLRLYDGTIFTGYS